MSRPVSLEAQRAMPAPRSASLARRLTVGVMSVACLAACQATPTATPAPTTLPTASVELGGTPIAPTPVGLTPEATTTPPAPQVGYLGAEPIPPTISTAASDLGLTLGSSQSADALRGVEVLLVADAARTADAGQAQAGYVVSIGNTAVEGGLALDTTQVRWDQAGFLLGLAAGWATEARQVGVVSAGTDVQTLSYRNGFLSGVRYSCPTCLIDQFDLPELSDAALAATQGAQFATYGSDVIFVAPAPATGAMLQALAQNGIVVIGVDADMTAAFGVDPTAWPDEALVDVRVDASAAFARALRDYAAGAAATGVQPMSIERDGLALGPWHDPNGLITPLDQRDLDAARARVASGALDVGVDTATGEPK